MVIVAAVNESEQAAEIVSEAANLAEALQEPLHIVHVISRTEFTEMGANSIDESGQAVGMEEIRKAAAKATHKAVEGLNVSYEPVGLIGKPAEEIVKYARNEGASYVVLGGRKRSPTGKALFGSVTQDVLLNAECPVLTNIHSE